MQKEDFVSFETAKLLKEKGYNEPTQYCYDMQGNLHDAKDNFFTIDKGLTQYNNHDNYDTIPVFSGATAPIIQEVLRWLRIAKHVFIEIGFNRWNKYYMAHIFNMDNPDEDPFKVTTHFDSYEEAADHAIRYYCKNMIGW